MTQNKEKAYKDFFSMINKSWSWKKLTVEERDKFIRYSYLESYIPAGNYDQVYKTLQNYYQFFTMLIDLENRPDII